MNINYGLFQVKEMKIRKKRERNQKIAVKALESISRWMESLGGKMGSAA
jgi:folate-dependent tRNA-U54 methylase TrmFO/GidA